VDRIEKDETGKKEVWSKTAMKEDLE